MQLNLSAWSQAFLSPALYSPQSYSRIASFSCSPTVLDMGRTTKSIRKSRQKAVNGEARSMAPQVGLLPKEAYTVLRSACLNRLVTVN